MRLGVLCLALLAAFAAHGQRNNRDDDATATKRACGVADCFLEREVRDFEVIDQTHLIVYTGAQRCAFHVEVHGALCDLSFAPELYFSKVNEVPLQGRMARSGDPFDRTAPDPFDAFETARRENRDLRVCSNDLGVQVHGGRFTESHSSTQTTDRFGNPTADCRISSVTSITDDQLVELYVERGVVPPLPPMGTGQIEVGEQEDEEGTRRRQRDDDAD